MICFFVFRCITQKTNTNMKKIFFLVFFSGFISLSWAQSGPSYGFKGGLNYNGNGDFIENLSSINI